MTRASVNGVSYCVPANYVDNDLLADQFPDWNIAKTERSTGVLQRHRAAADEYASDLAVASGEKFFREKAIDPRDIDFLILCTQTPDFYLPTTAVLVHHRLGLAKSAGAVDVTLGCSGYVYSLGLAKSLIESGQAQNVLLITSETLSKLTNPGDKSTIPIFGDAAATTLITGRGDGEGMVGFVYGTDGAGAENLLVPHGGLRSGVAFSPKSAPQARGLEEGRYDLYMDGPEIFNFTISTVPSAVESVLAKSGLRLDEIDAFVFHQANKFMLEHLRKKLGVPAEKFVLALENVGNTSSSSIPIALADAETNGQIMPGDKVLVLGFGVGYSWAGAVLHW